MAAPGPAPETVGSTLPAWPHHAAGPAQAAPEEAPLGSGQRLVLGILGSVVAAVPEEGDGAGRGAARRALSARYLISLFALDALAWGTGKIFQYEVYMLVQELGWCYVVAALVMVSAEVCVEFAASAATPYIYTLVYTDRLVTSKRLVHFALKAYAVSNTLALLIYPWLFVAMHLAKVPVNPAMVIMLAVVRSLQYGFGNQIGDASVEMAKPHWLATFEGLQLAVPGLGVLGKLRLFRPATPDSLALYLTLMRVLVFGLLAAAYTMIRKKDSLRWALAVVLLVWNAVACLLLLLRLSFITDGIVEETIEEDREPVRALTSLRRNELSYLAFVVILLGIPPQSAEALQSVMVLELPSPLLSSMAMIMGVAVLSVLLWRICREPASIGGQHGRGSEVLTTLRSRQNFSWGWLAPTACIFVLLGLGATCVLIGTREAMYVALAIWLPIGPLSMVLAVSINTFLLLHNASRRTDLVYWQNVLKVFVNGPLLAVNWSAVQAVGCDDEDGAAVRAGGTTVGVAAGALALLCLHYLLVDRALSPAASLRALVDGVLRPGGDALPESK